ncbi:MAG: zinc metallopeptidase [Candidatus Dojkabacteria bacterium]|nr:MAG: zinc metallopeptidase [Candidatus Dojkabacteria bacterium]
MSYTLYIILSIAGFLFAAAASFFTSATFSKHRMTPAAKNITPVELANDIIKGEGLNVTLTTIPGTLNDHYDPFKNIVALGADTANQSGMSQLAVTAHEFGHALQDHHSGILFKIRNMLANVVGISTNIGYLLFIAGLALSFFDLAVLGLILFSATTLFMFITLPIEIDASVRGMKLLRKYGVISDREAGSARELLTAAASTYVAGFLQSFIQLLYFASMLTGRRRD